MMNQLSVALVVELDLGAGRPVVVSKFSKVSWTT